YGSKYIVLLAGDHVYKMDYEIMLKQHVESGADVTVGCLEMPRSESSAFGIIHVDENDVIQSFLEKPADPPPMPGKPDTSLASMGIYVFDTQFLFDQLRRDAADSSSAHDFGKDIIPYIVKNGRAIAHQFSRSCVRSGDDPRSYWRDVGTVDAYWSANIDLTDVVPELDLMTAHGRSGPTPKSPRRRNSCMPRRDAAARPSLRSCPGAASFPARRCGVRCCSPAFTCTRTRGWRMRCSCPMSMLPGMRACALSCSTV